MLAPLQTLIAFIYKSISAAGNCSLQHKSGACIKKTFREDLYYRWKVIHIHTPSLREVSEDISVWADHFLAKYCKMMNTDPKQFTRGALEALLNYSWPRAS
jgi:DNA-binding NtrC family response regulator